MREELSKGGEPHAVKRGQVSGGGCGGAECGRECSVLLLGEHPGVKGILSTIGTVAKTSVPVLITGESGTGKEIVARLLHEKSDRRRQRIVALNCAALPRDVIENELFGHEREAYTGAASSRDGAFDLAHGGTLFLDEIGEMHHQVQAKLLRVIEQQSFRRLGGNQDVSVNVRIIAATNRHIPTALHEGTLREDLYYRLSVVEIHLPPLRERRTDIRLLAEHFVNLFCEKHQTGHKCLSGDSLSCLEMYDWPGNVRELRNVLESAVLMCQGEEIQPAQLTQRVTSATSLANCVNIPLGTNLEAAERLFILQTLAMTGQNKSLAARILGLSRKSLYDRLARYGGGEEGS